MSESPDRAKIRVLVVDDSAVARELLTHVLESDPRIRVVGSAASGNEAVEAVAQKRPDVVTMDYHMPAMNGLDAARKIMETHPVPIIIVSASSAAAQVASAHAFLDAGALAVLEKPVGPSHRRYRASAKELVDTVKWVSEVRVVKRWPKRGAHVVPAAALPAAGAAQSAQRPFDVIAIGASTGGPFVLKTILSDLPKDFTVPILVVQHIATGFTQGLVDWLAQSSGFDVRVARSGDPVLATRAYVAPDGVHMTLSHDGRIVLSAAPPENGHRPSVSCLFRSVAKHAGGRAVGVLLTGMGKDGADGLKLMKETGAITIAQDQQTSVVHGMPGEAIGLGAATHVLAADAIAEALRNAAARTAMEKQK